MRFFQTLLSGAALIAAASAAITIDSFPPSVVAGQTYTVAFSPKDSNQYTFVLRKGPSGNLATLDTLTTTATGGSFTWTVSKSLADGADYALQIKQGGQENYSGQFSLSGGSGTASASSAAASASSAASSASASLSSAVSRSASLSAASASASVSRVSNSTVASATLSRSASASGSTKPTGSASSTSSTSPPQTTNAAISLVASPLIAMLGAFAAFAYLA